MIWRESWIENISWSPSFHLNKIYFYHNFVRVLSKRSWINEIMWFKQSFFEMESIANQKGEYPSSVLVMLRSCLYMGNCTLRHNLGRSTTPYFIFLYVCVLNIKFAAQVNHLLRNGSTYLVFIQYSFEVSGF